MILVAPNRCANYVITFPNQGSYDPNGRVVGPTIYGAMLVDGPGRGGVTVSNDSSARAAVRHAKAAGYQFIKVYNSIPAEAFRAVLAESRAIGLGVTGHGVRSIPLDEALAGGQSLVVHAEEYLYTILRNTKRAEEIEEAAGMTKRANGSLIPNLSTYQAIARQWANPAVIGSTCLSARDGSHHPATT